MSKRPKHNAASVGKVSHEQAIASASTVYARSTDLEVLVRHQVYKKTVAQIDESQLNLNKVRSHVSTSLKAKDRPRRWKGWSKNNWAAGFLFGLLVGAVAAALIYNLYLNPQTANAPASAARTNSNASVSP